jgi:fused signal recognition particle receptor
MLIYLILSLVFVSVLTIFYFLIHKKKKTIKKISLIEQGLTKTKSNLTFRIRDLFKHKEKIDEIILSQIEEILLTSDVGVKTVVNLIQKLKSENIIISNFQDLEFFFKKEFLNILNKPNLIPHAQKPPHIILFIGVNGVGKTTSVGKLAHKYKKENKSVLLVCADTFRAASFEQLNIWARKTSVNIHEFKEKADPASLVFDAIKNAKEDVVIIDTAGRLHTKVNLMEELKKIKRVISNLRSDAPHETLLVLDSTYGQNALIQAKEFHSSLNLTGFVLTKLDGTSKGGFLIGIVDNLSTPVRYVGIGEAVGDLITFNPEEYVTALFN